MIPIPVYHNTIIYVACIRNHATGGPELLHQIVSKLTKQGYNAKMLYYPKVKDGTDPVHPNYVIYQNQFVFDVEDEPQNILIVPEIATELYQHKKQIRSAIWWLSVDFYYAKYKKKKLRLKAFLGLIQFFRFNSASTHPTYHLAQSYYALDHLRKNGVANPYFLSDYLNKKFFESRQAAQKREDIVLYNPKKGAAFTKKLIQAGVEFQWQPIINLSPAQVADLLTCRKVYIDFGHHPGKDRFPREAAVSGCCIITGTDGSAAYQDDVDIPLEFKFEAIDSNISSILNSIKKCHENFDEEAAKFNNYRLKIRQEEEAFETALAQIFVKEPEQMKS